MSALLTADQHGNYAPIVIAISSKDTERLLAVYLTIFLGFGLGVVLVGALLTRMLVTTTFTPLREVERTAAAIADGDFSQRLGGATPNTEVGRLNRSLNTMLNRIDRAFRDRARTIEQMRRFVGDASHELRTPLVSVRGYAELYRMGALHRPTRSRRRWTASRRRRSAWADWSRTSSSSPGWTRRSRSSWPRSTSCHSPATRRSMRWPPTPAERSP